MQQLIKNILIIALFVALCSFASAPTTVTSSDVLDKLIYYGAEGKMVVNINNSLAAVNIDSLKWNFKNECGQVVDYKLYVNSSECGVMIPNYAYKMVCTDIVDNISAKVSRQCNNESYILDYTNTTYSCFVPAKNIPLGESQVLIDADIKWGYCGPRKGFGYKIDAVPTVNILGVNYTRSDWAWWNVSCNYRVQLNKTGTNNYTYRATYFELNSTNINFTALYNASSMFVTNSSDSLIPYKVFEFNKTASTAILWINASPYNSSKMTFYVYYNCTGAADRQNAPGVFIYNDDFEDGSTTGWTNNSQGKISAVITAYVFDGVYSAKHNSTAAGTSYVRSEQWPSISETFIVEYAALRNGSSTSDSGWVISNFSSSAISADININWGYNSTAYRAYPHDAGATYTGAYAKLWDSQGVGADRWVKFKNEIYSAGGDTTRNLYVKNNTDVSFRNLVNTTGSFGTLAIDKARYMIVSSWNDLVTARNYFDNVLVYPWYNWTAEVNQYGAQEVTSSPCLYSGVGDFNVACTDSCAFTASNLFRNRIFITGCGAMTGFRNITNSSFFTWKSCCFVNW